MTQTDETTGGRAPSSDDYRGEHSNRWIYIVVAAAFVALLVIGLAAYRTEKKTAAAEQKAEQFLSELQAAGFHIRDEERAKDVVVALFGDDGGRMAEDPDSAFLRGLMASRLATGSGVVMRPVVADRRMFLAEEIALSVYAPEKLPAFKEFVAGLKTADTLPR